MHEIFEKWLSDNNTFFAEHNISVEVNHGERPTISADFEKSPYLGQIIVWKEGYCFTQLLSVELGGDDPLIVRQDELTNYDEFWNVFQEFFAYFVE